MKWNPGIKEMENEVDVNACEIMSWKVIPRISLRCIQATISDFSQAQRAAVHGVIRYLAELTSANPIRIIVILSDKEVSLKLIDSFNFPLKGC